jgi:hypothetical protein
VKKRKPRFILKFIRASKSSIACTFKNDPRHISISISAVICHLKRLKPKEVKYVILKNEKAFDTGAVAYSFCLSLGPVGQRLL